MTTTITIETHDWPVAIITNSSHNHSSDNVRSNGHSWTEEFLPANSKKVIAISSTNTVAVRELPKEATSLNHAEELQGAVMANSARAGTRLG